MISALNRQLEKKGVKVYLRTCVKEVLMDQDEETPSKKCITGVKLFDERIISADAVIIATGGKSYESTGSTGMGINLQKQQVIWLKILSLHLFLLRRKRTGV